MLRTKEEIRQEIDQTLDRLLENDKVLKVIAGDPAYCAEETLLRNTQESLLAHLMHMDHLLKKRTRQQPLKAKAILRHLYTMQKTRFLPRPKARLRKKTKAIVIHK